MQNFLWTSLDGDTLETDNAGDAIYVVSELKGFSEPPEFNQVRQQAPYQHGATPTRAFARVRPVKFKLHMFAATLPNMEAARRYVGRVFSGLASTELPNEGVLKVTGEDTVEYSISAVPEGVDYSVGRPGRGPFHQIASVYLSGCDPWWRVDPPNEADLVSGGVTNVQNGGDVPVFPTWIINGPCESPRLENLTTGLFVEFAASLLDGWRLEVSHKFGVKRAVAVEIADEENTVNWMPFLTADSVWWKLLVGSNDIETTSAYNDGAGTISWQTLLQTIPI
jgi:hypothetical protein